MKHWTWGVAIAGVALVAGAGLAQRVRVEPPSRQPNPKQISASRRQGPRADEEVLRRVYEAFLDYWQKGYDWKAFFAPDAVSSGYSPSTGQRSISLAEADAELAKVRLLFPDIQFRVLWTRPVVAEDGRTGVLVFEQETRLANKAGERVKHRFIGVASFRLVEGFWQIARLDEYHLPEAAP